MSTEPPSPSPEKDPTTNPSSLEKTESAARGLDPMEHRVMEQVDAVLSHVWMIRTFLKHSDEAADDEELAEVHRELYDYMLALGPSRDANDSKRYLQLAKKKFSKLKQACELFQTIQPEVSGHMNFCMAAKSLRISVDQISSLLSE